MDRYRLSPLAESDLDDIWLFIADAATPETADRLIDDITDRFVMLAIYPAAGRSRDDIEPGARAFPVPPYNIYYKAIASRGVEIARVLHASRDLFAAWRT
jgi:toxin ParE1/3/4